MSVITIERKILQKNDEIALSNKKLFAEKGITAYNLVSSPGSGKTSLIERTIEKLKSKINFAVITGDLQTSLDAQRIDALNVPVVQIVTNGACHLDATLVRNAFTQIENEQIEILFIENVGNLVCPAEFQLGEKMKITLISTTEGEDKPLKYPVMFRNSNVLIINKIDLLPFLEFSIAKLKENALAINGNLKIFEVSCRTGEGLENWFNFLLNDAKLNAAKNQA
ncbi:MAG: hydrogenase nickel incorporation protein HypB [Ignavibacteria bacterium]|nr:hydrogenase nickel incorporation protein HypB [Ignavibacteria bacterium]